MSRSKELLDKRVKTAELFHRHASSYFRIIEEFVERSNPAERRQVRESLGFIESVARYLTPPDPKKPQDEYISYCNAIFEHLSEISTAMDIVTKTLENDNYMQLAMREKSTTYAKDIQQLRKNAKAARAAFETLAADEDETMAEDLIEPLGIEKNPDNAYRFVLDTKNFNRFTMQLIYHLLETLTGERRRKLDLVIERQKDDILKASRVDTSMFSGAQETLLRLNLVPDESVSISELVSKLTDRPADIDALTEMSPDEIFRDLAAAGPGIILLNRSTRSPLEFDMRGLIDIDYVTTNDLKTTPFSGLNNKVIRRFVTTRILPAAGAAEPLRRFPGAQDEWIVIETISPGLYRLLRKDGRFVLRPDEIRGLLEGPSGRPQSYNDIHAREILRKCLDEKATYLFSLYQQEASSQNSAEILKLKIIDKLSRWFSENILGKRVSDVNDLKKMLTDNKILTHVLVESIGITITDRSFQQDQILSMLVSLDVLTSRLSKEIERRWENIKITNRMLTEYSPTDLSRMLTDSYQKVLRGALDEVDKYGLLGGWETSLKEFFMKHK